MKHIRSFTLPDTRDEISVSLYDRAQLLDIRPDYDSDEIVVYYVDDSNSDELVTLNFYVMVEGAEFPDTFPCKYFKSVVLSDSIKRFVFFGMPPLTRKPIVVSVPNAKPPTDKVAA